jgi:hypothetical protein
VYWILELTGNLKTALETVTKKEDVKVDGRNVKYAIKYTYY